MAGWIEFHMSNWGYLSCDISPEVTQTTYWVTVGIDLYNGEFC